MTFSTILSFDDFLYIVIRYDNAFLKDLLEPVNC